MMTGRSKRIIIPTAFILVLLAIMTGSSYPKAVKKARRNACLNNLRLIDSATESCGCAENWKMGNPVDTEKIVQYMKENILPQCPSGGKYLIPAVGSLPACSKHGPLPQKDHWPRGWNPEPREDNHE